MVEIGDQGHIAVLWYANQHGLSVPEEMYVRVFDATLEPLGDQIHLSASIDEAGLNPH